ncbi:MAG: GNAT family N-acetyltransferase [Legionellales bacterium]|nr:GNAT family N-acetyltransferase [Legionellales bacterium]|tara:strand:- start:166 stop:744 length:579 start_codon:yes stop_codon:yes gene_type:complete
MKDLIKNIKIECNEFSLELLDSNKISDRYLHWLNDPEVNRFSRRSGESFSIDDISQYIEISNKSNDVLLLGIFLNKSKKHIGNIQLRYFDKRNRLAEISTLLGEKDYWGKGIVVEATRNLINFGFNELNIHKFILGNIVPNRASSFKSTTLGAKLEGTRRSHFLFEGKYVDVLEYGILKEDFYKVFPEFSKK